MKVGDKIVDNDPRMKGRALTVHRIGDVYVWAYRVKGCREYRISRNRIHTDSKPRKSGFTLIKEYA